MTERQHGYARYRLDKCRCRRCRAACSAYRRQVTMRTTAGTWNPWVDAEPARAHVRELGAVGIGYKQVAKVAGVARTTVTKLLHGTRGGPPTKRLRPETAAAILAVQPTPATFAPLARVDAAGTQRRIQALTCLGWSLTAQATEVGGTCKNYHALMYRPRVSAATAALVRALYDRLSMTPPTPGPAASNAKRYAHAKAWFPPLAWDDETIDDPSAIPVLVPPTEWSNPDVDELTIQHAAAGHTEPPADTATRRELALRLRASGEPFDTIGRLLGVTGARAGRIHLEALEAAEAAAAALVCADAADLVALGAAW